MFNKILIANRGEIAVRIIRACRELGIATLALYQASDRDSLHVRLADEAAPLPAGSSFGDEAAILEMALSKGAEAVHPGYGFLAERPAFGRRCQAAGVVFIGPPPDVMESAANKIGALEMAQAAGFPTPPHTSTAHTDWRAADLFRQAELVGYPLVVKSIWGGRGRGARLVLSPQRLERAVQAAQAESLAVYGDRSVYLEKAILPAHQIGVQVLGDAQGRRIHLGEREGSLLMGNQKMIEETPAPCLSEAQRHQLHGMALALAEVFAFQGVGTIEFLLDEAGKFYFLEIKPRIQISHPITEMTTRVDLVKEQIRLAAGLPLAYAQEDVHMQGWAMQGRVTAEDPWRQYLPQPGRLKSARFPGGPGVRIDTYVSCGSAIPTEYDPLVAKLVVWGPDRAICAIRLRQALRECHLTGAPTNLPLLLRLVDTPEFIRGKYSTDALLGAQVDDSAHKDDAYRHLAVIAALAQMRRQEQHPVIPERLLSGWHRDSRRIPS